MLLLGHTRREGTYVTLAFTQVAIVTSETLSAGNKEETRHFTLKEETFAYFMLNDSDSRFVIVK